MKQELLNASPGQGSRLHGLVSFLGPTQSEPLLIGGGLLQLRFRTWVPFPQVELHGPKEPQFEKPPSTVKQTKKITDRFKILSKCNCSLHILDLGSFVITLPQCFWESVSVEWEPLYFLLKMDNKYYRWL